MSAAPAAPRRRPGARRRPRPRRLLDRRPGAAGDLPRARHQRRRGHLGAGLLQPGDGAGRGPGGATSPAASDRARAAAVGLAIFAGAGLACGARRQLSTLIARPLRAGARRRAGGHRGAGAAAGHGRLRAPRGRGLGQRRGDRSGARARRSAASSPSWSPGSRSSCSRCRWRLAAAVPILAVARHEAATGIVLDRAAPHRPAAPAGQHRPGDGLGGDRRGALPARPAADRRLAPDPDRGRDRGHGDAAGGHARQPPRPAGAQRQGARRGGGDPRLRRPRRAGAAAQGRGGADPAAADPGRRRPLAGPLGADRDGAGRARPAGDPRRLDDLRPPRRGRDRPARADPGLHRRHRRPAPRRDRRRHRGDPRLAGSTRC